MFCAFCAERRLIFAADDEDSREKWLDIMRQKQTRGRATMSLMGRNARNQTGMIERVSLEQTSTARQLEIYASLTAFRVQRTFINRIKSQHEHVDAFVAEAREEEAPVMGGSKSVRFKMADLSLEPEPARPPPLEYP